MIEIRKLGAGDLAAYRALHRHGLAQGEGAFVQSVEEDHAIPDSVIEEMLARGEGWGAFKGDRLIAKMTIDALPYAILSHTRWIHALYAHPEARGAGAAKQLVQAAIADARAHGAMRINLWVNPENVHARRFYEGLGFCETGRVPGGLLHGKRFVDDMLMCLQFGGAP